MKILHIHDRPAGYGGGEVYFAEVVAGQLQRGHQVATLHLLAADAGESSRPGKHVLHKPHGYFKGLAKLPRLLQIVEQEAPDVIHLHCLFTPVWLRALLSAYPLVLTLHSVEMLCFLSSKIRADNRQICRSAMGWHCIASGCYKPLQFGGWLYGPYQAWLRYRLLRMLPRLHKLIAPSASMAEELRLVGVPAERIAVVPHFTALPQVGVSDTKRPAGQLLFVGRFSWEKGVSEFVDMLNRLQTPGWQATMVGEGPMLAELEQRLAEAGLTSRVRLAGKVAREAMPQVYQQADLLVVPSQVPEAFGLAGIEAMAAGRPVVGFDIGGIRDWLAHETSGFLVEAGDRQGLARRVDQLLQDDALRTRMGEAAGRRAKELYSLPVHLQRLQSVYEEAAGAAR
ncbi:glycosyltransferase family 4 protein [Methylomonas rhizoryzae]|uniref:glycosyltransferase family 4 protein n=1 Tax=Methylomonas rhizoryzae TaxID=2608981 RepID=UPI00123274C4|nr:glycosyltransferase family 4 protein [Methylomonas rhizoryzae]